MLEVPPHRSGGPPIAQPALGYPTGTPGPHRLLQSYGTQSRHDWSATDTQEKMLLDVMRGEYLYRVSVVGTNVVLRLQYGTVSTISLTGLLLPFVAFVPGQLNLYATKLDGAQPANAVPTLTVATGGASVLRSIVPAGALDERIRRITALAAGVTATIGGNPVPLGIGLAIDIAAPTTTAGGPVLAEWSV